MRLIYVGFVLIILTACSHSPKSVRIPAGSKGALSCTLGGFLVRHTEVVYASKSVACHESDIEERECVDGLLVGSHSYMCGFAKKIDGQDVAQSLDSKDCEFSTIDNNKMIVPYGHSIIAYKQKEPKGYCLSESRTCGKNNRLSGSFEHMICIPK